MMANGFKDGSAILYTSDNLPPRKEDTEVSPQALPVHNFAETNYMGQVRPGVIRLVGRENTAGLTSHYDRPIHRVCSRAETSLFGVSYIERGLVVTGVDQWESIHDFRLVNTTQPNVEFET